MLKFTIPLPPVTKKNHQQIVINPKTKRPIVIPSKQYKEYEEAASWYIPKGITPIAEPVCVSCRFFLPTRRKCDLTNLLQAIDDIMVEAGLLADDNYTIIESHDGSRAFYDKENPRTEVTITRAEPRHNPTGDEQQAERDEIARILSDNFTPEEYDASDFEWCALQLQQAGYHK